MMLVPTSRSTKLAAITAGFTALLALSACSTTSSGTSQTNTAVKSVDSIDPQRYSGTWYEIARLPNRFQNQCVSDVTATYDIDENAGFKVTNRCKTKDGATESAVGRARQTDQPAQLQVSFLPSLLSRLDWLPFGWGDYWVLDLPSNYNHVMVGTPNNRFLWILARDPEMSRFTYDNLVQKAARMGFDTGAIQKTPQAGSK